MTTCVPMLVCSYFYPRPPRGGRLQSSPVRRRGCLFLSTPSARRATASQQYALALHIISIHALREEGDLPARSDGRLAS